MRIEVETSRFPRTTERHIRRVLKWLNARDFEGLEVIKVIDDDPDDSDAIKVPAYLRGFLSNGRYSRKMKDRPAEVVLYANDIYFGIPRSLSSTRMATLKLARTLAHEVGHHVIATRGYIYKPWEKYKSWNGVGDPYEEKMAEAYGSDVIEEMLKRWPYRLGKLAARILSNLYYHAGIQDYWDGNYKSAASFHARAHSLNLENEDAGQCYRHDMEKLRTQEPSPLSSVERDWLSVRYNPFPISSDPKGPGARSTTVARGTRASHRR